MASTRFSGPHSWRIFFVSSYVERCARVHRHVYGETLGRWRSADLLIGLAYMAQREADERPIGDIAAQGLPFGDGLLGQPRAEAQVRACTILGTQGIGLLAGFPLEG